jgi:hypothetical protein
MSRKRSRKRANPSNREPAAEAEAVECEQPEPDEKTTEEELAEARAKITQLERTVRFMRILVNTPPARRRVVRRRPNPTTEPLAAEERRDRERTAL